MVRMLALGARPFLSRTVTLVCAAAFFNVVFLFLVVPKYVEKRYVKRSPKLTLSGALYDKDSSNELPDYTSEFEYGDRPACPKTSNFLTGAIKVNMEWAEKNYWVESKIEDLSSQRENDMGKYYVVSASNVHLLKPRHILRTPAFCRPSLTVAFIIPFRDREPHLRTLLGHLTPILRRQLISYSLFVVEQVGHDTFNKGRLMNSGFEVAYMLGSKLDESYDCYVFQDVDLLSERDDLLFRCHPGPYVDHLSLAIDKFNYEPLCCGMTVGGVLAFKPDEFRKVNGFSNCYWGWGGEDDDMNVRIRKHALKLVRPEPDLGRFVMIKHSADQNNPRNVKAFKKLSQTWTHSENDGLVDLNTEVKGFHVYPLFTKILVDVKVPDFLKLNASVEIPPSEKNGESQDKKH